MLRNLWGRLVCILLVTAMLASFFMICANADDAPSDEQKPVLLLMGDSIPDAFGIDNRDEACYGRIVADTDGYVYRNIGRTAMDSAELLDFIDLYAVWDNERNGWRNVEDYVAEADVICISIGANDYFDQENTTDMLVKALFGLNKAELDAIADQYYENLCALIDLIRSINPDVTVIMQTIYQSWYGIAANANLALTKRINGMIEKYDLEHPGSIHICDVGPAMTRRPENLSDDCVHPNANGNVAIAQALLQTLYDLGLGSETTPVVNVPGEDYHYFLEYYDAGAKGVFLTMLVMLATGNGVNIFRLLKDVL